MKHILLAIDRSAQSWEAARLAIRMAPRLKAPVTVLSVVMPGTPRRAAKGQALREYEVVSELVDDIVKELAVAGVKARGEVRTSKAKEVAGEIIASAKRLDADLIVMGCRARGELTGLVLGSVSPEVAMHSGRPVVIGPGGGRAR